MKDWKNDPTERDGERQLDGQGDAKLQGVHDTLSRGLTASVKPRDKDLSDAINEYYHLRERTFQAMDLAKLLPAQVRNEWQRSVGKINLILESTGAEFDALLTKIDDYVEGVKRPQVLSGDPLPSKYPLQEHQIESIISVIRSLKETYFRFQRELDSP